MGRWLLLVLAARPLLWAQGGPELTRLLERVAVEAEGLAVAAPKLVATETLRQRALVPASTRPGPNGQVQVEMAERRREIISEYTYGSFKDAPGVLHEFRRVISVDGQPVGKPVRARETLLRGLLTADDRHKRRLLQELARHGLDEVGVDFAQSILLFRRPLQAGYQFDLAGEELVGPERAVVIRFSQRDGPGGLTIFQERDAIRRPLRGRLWVRAEDGVPLRMELVATRSEPGFQIEDHGTIDYWRTSRGLLLPAAVTHRQTVNGQVAFETTYWYQGFRRFASDSSIRYDPEEALP